MSSLPVLGRLTFGDYARIVITWSLFLADAIIRAVLRLVPSPVMSIVDRWRYRVVTRLWPRVFRRGDEGNGVPSGHPVGELQHTADICAYWGHAVDEHLVETKDGYRLGLHRILPSVTLTTSVPEGPRPVVLMVHGFLMNSEVFVCHPGGTDHNLALSLSEKGYDVWLGNVRGNKYSCNHRQWKPADKEFWDFSLDEYALIDLPAMVDYVLTATGAKSLGYVGFSQGTTICFAALSLLPALRTKINMFVALAPSTKPHGLTNSLIASCVRSSQQLMFLVFGRRALLPSCLFYQDMFTPRFYAFAIDRACKLLFNWSGKSMSTETKDVVYQHLYSLGAVRVMVHWFQIIREQRFQMYDHLSSVRDSFRAGTSTKQTIPVQRINSGGFAGTGDTVLFDGTPNGETITQQLVMASGTSTMSPSKRDTVQHRLYRPRSLSASASSLRRAQGQAEAVRMNTASASYASHSVGHVPPRFPTTQLRPPNVNRLNVPSTGNSADTPCPPIAIFYGGSDTIPDMPDLLHAINFYTIEDIAAETRALVDGWCRTGLAGGIILHDAKKPDGSMTAATMDAIAHADGSPLVYLKCMPSYEHLSLLWGDLNAHEIVPDVARVLDGYRWETRKC